MERKLEIGKFDIRDWKSATCVWGGIHPLGVSETISSLPWRAWRLGGSIIPSNGGQWFRCRLEGRLSFLVDVRAGEWRLDACLSVMRSCEWISGAHTSRLENPLSAMEQSDVVSTAFGVIRAIGISVRLTTGSK